MHIGSYCPAHLWTLSRRPSRRRVAAALATGGLVLAPLAAVSPAHAATNGSKVVISEVYGGGGNSGTTYRQGFVEL